jgi:multicomponent Na+:H+ antiporter subunit D
MADIAASIADPATSKVVLFASVLFFMGFGLKAALAPFHAWLPDAHSSAPTPVSAMLSGLLIKVLGIYVISRLFFNVFGMSQAISAILISLAVISMFVASFMAFGQNDLKRLLAYSTISQVGYIMLGLGVATPLAIMGALFHLFNHSIFKPLLFLNAGAVEDVCGTRDLSRMSGVLSRSRLTGYTNLIGSLSICGIPPLGGFWSKIIIIFACIQANRPFLAFIAAVVSMLTLGYYFKAVNPVLFGVAGSQAPAGKKRLPPEFALPLLILAALSVVSVLLLVPGIGRHFLGDAITVLVKGREYATILTGIVR